MAPRTALKRGGDHGSTLNLQEEGTKRLTLNLSVEAYLELSELSRLRSSSMTEVIRLALGLVRIALLERREGNKLMIANPQGQPIRELVLP